eukprot:gnl/TRDRNA2_/TRDRNA2_181351_c0_seq1.p1 gnl/TRDRNA2_/TRDRNA2_181351_c0~~gnl/TRDRNA2_/TRDRNA2_181351_c0_seq1.p1  ORF type:complete len:338 (+),score=80.84 gnl/TRDRNA2_/TRDRNA2_181351_c0_seq1:54-1016(+)
MAATVPPLGLSGNGGRNGGSDLATFTESARGDRSGDSKTSTGFNAHLQFNSARGPGGAPPTVDQVKMRNKLIDVGQRFIGFDKVIEEDTVKRRDAEIKRLTAVQQELVTVEKALNLEIKRRVDANKQVQMGTEVLANDMLERLQSGVLVRIDKLATSIESLTLRCTALEKGIAQFRGELPSKLQIDTAALVKEISALRNHMDIDRAARIERDTALLRRLTEVETSDNIKFEQGLSSVIREMDSIKAEIDNLARTEDGYVTIGSDSRTEKFRAFILEEIAGMKNTLAVTAQAREQTDDEMVQAMNQYTNALQKGLHAANKR